ncbi:pyridoxal-phosphate dependent enzyme [Actinocrispum sp. NPDC049592]|uniref:pyridoxal-phosphate dependent enzyme n=1 Tax=Actinocrispum sp. NPDC049592 TaxID=3154835 RepID=UPI00341587B6
MYVNTEGNTWSARSQPTVGDPRELHRTLPGFAPTPLLEARVATRRVLVKDEHLRAGMPSFKILGAAWAVFRSLGGTTGGFADLDIDPKLTLVTATAGNHGRAVAYVARLLGAASHIFIPAGTSEARVEAIRGEGAEVHIVEGDYQAAVDAAVNDASTGNSLLVGDVGESMTAVWASEGYRTILRELDEQLGQAPDLVVVPVGAGTFAKAVVTHYRQDGPRPRILTVEPDTAACLLKSLQAGHPVTVPGPHPSTMAGLNTGEVDGQAWETLHNGVDAAIGVSDEDTFEAMRTLAAQNITAGECGAAAAAGLSAYFAAGNPLNIPENATIVLMNTEGINDPANYDKVVSVLSR